MIPERLGPYDIQKLLGEGGMGSVYLGEHDESGQQAAVKTLSTRLSQDEDFRVRFAGEIESLKKLRHPNIVQLFGWGEEDGVLFYAMEFIDGQSLQQRLASGDRVEWREAIQIGIDVCKALKHAHDNGIIHRDLKPANLLWDNDKCIKLTDFGIAKLFGYTQLTVEGGVVGTADYMAPEQALGQPVNHRCDLYSLGSVLFTLLAGRPPFLAKSMPEVVHKVCYEPAQPVRRFNASVPPQLEALLGELLEKEAARRPPTARALVTRLEAMQHGLTETSSPAKPDADKQSTDFEYTEPGETSVPDEPRVHSATTRFAPEERPSDAEQRTEAGSGVTSSDVLQSSPITRAPADELTEVGESKASDGVVPSSPKPAGKGRRPYGARFTTIQEDADAAAASDGSISASQRWVIGALAAALLAIGGIVAWQTLVPPSADELYTEIMAIIDDDNADLYAASADIERFLQLYPDDARHDEVASCQEEIELERMQRRFERRGRGSAAQTLSPIERAYLAAIERARTHPEEAAAQLQAIIDLYGDQEDPPTATQQTVALARRQLVRLQQTIDSQAEQQIDLLEERFQAAQALEQSNPAQAKAMYESVVLLYADHHWATNVVSRAEAALDRLAKTSE